MRNTPGFKPASAALSSVLAIVSVGRVALVVVPGEPVSAPLKATEAPFTPATLSVETEEAPDLLSKLAVAVAEPKLTLLTRLPAASNTFTESPEALSPTPEPP